MSRVVGVAREAKYAFPDCVIYATCNKGKGGGDEGLTRQKLIAQVNPVFSALLFTCV